MDDPAARGEPSFSGRRVGAPLGAPELPAFPPAPPAPGSLPAEGAGFPPVDTAATDCVAASVSDGRLNKIAQAHTGEDIHQQSNTSTLLRKTKPQEPWVWRE